MPDIAPDLNGDGVCDRGPGDCIVREGELVFVNGTVPTGDHDIETIYVPEGRAARVAFINSSTERFYRFRLLLEGEQIRTRRAARSTSTRTSTSLSPSDGRHRV